jgi:hypothetical protein
MITAQNLGGRQQPSVTISPMTRLSTAVPVLWPVDELTVGTPGVLFAEMLAA